MIKKQTLPIKYCQECNNLLTDEDALHKHNLKEHSAMLKDVISQDASIKEETSESLTIKEEPILDCNDCGICDSCTTIHGVVMSINY